MWSEFAGMGKLPMWEMRLNLPVSHLYTDRCLSENMPLGIRPVIQYGVQSGLYQSVFEKIIPYWFLYQLWTDICGGVWKNIWSWFCAALCHYTEKPESVTVFPQIIRDIMPDTVICPPEHFWFPAPGYSFCLPKTVWERRPEYTVNLSAIPKGYDAAVPLGWALYLAQISRVMSFRVQLTDSIF